MGIRMYWIYRVILESKGVGISARDILKRLETYDIYMDIKTVYRCIHELNAFFYEIFHADIIRGKQKTGYIIQHEIFDDGELQFLLDSIVFHQDLRDEDKQNLIDKLLMFSSFSQQERLISFQPSKKDIQFSLFVNLSTIMKAIENKSVLTFQYITYEIHNHHLKEVPSLHGNEKDQYILSPYQIVQQNNHYYIIGYNEKYKNELSTYRIDRMRLIQMTHLAYQDIREQFDMTDEIEKMTNMYITSQRDTLKIECHQKLLREISSRFGNHILVQRFYQQQYLVTIEDTPISEGLIGWLMMLQQQVKVIAPETLQREMKKRMMKMVTLYEDVL